MHALKQRQFKVHTGEKSRVRDKLPCCVRRGTTFCVLQSLESLEWGQCCVVKKKTEAKTKRVGDRESKAEKGRFNNHIPV